MPMFYLVFCYCYNDYVICKLEAHNQNEVENQIERIQWKFSFLKIHVRHGSDQRPQFSICLFI